MLTMPCRALAAVALALLLVPTAVAAAATKQYDVRISAEYAHRWNVKGEYHPDTCRGWELGDGELLGSIDGGDSQPLEIESGRGGWSGDTPGWERPRASFSSHHAVRIHSAQLQTADCSPCGPLSELGLCRDPLPDEQVVGGCKRGRVDGYADVAVIKNTLMGNVFINARDKLEKCDRWALRTMGAPYEIPRIEFRFPGAGARLARLPGRQTLVFRDRRREGRGCRAWGTGMRACETLTMEIEIKRR
ncbi:hypothetical protein VSS74_24250 [Conexibacter stalactiti]|uniref:Uncharacterized protein n=1 Tax=Conexibacter stalactiti TaxID=1940611 RepID=A0ABU4HVY0_9ACTN|nr:hypothetical protein [Conexibacter stalactiti]MDW5597483.1 hypothetical protein [Conexibacter stalactiti]MEC5038125.1 hypothetical protein [Conexibacter stalactiti]